MSEVVLAVDAGNSKTDVWLVAGDGHVLGTARGAGFAPQLLGAEQAVAGLAETVARAVAVAGREGTVPVASHVSACLANVDLPAQQAGLEAAVAARGWAPSQVVVNDIYALLRCGVDDAHGVAVVCGAGVNCLARHRDGREVRFPAVGQLSGDWGGGGFLWQEAMWWAARDADGRGPRTALTDALPARAGLADMAGLIEAAHLGRLDATTLGGLTATLFAVAEDGDRVAASVVVRQAEELVAYVGAALRRLAALDEPMPVVLGGGVLTAGHPLLMDTLQARLAEQAPRATTRLVRTPPVVGAALLGLDHVGAAPSAGDRLRAEALVPVVAPAGQAALRRGRPASGRVGGRA